MACCIALVTIVLAHGTESYCDEPNLATRVEFVIGDYLKSEGGAWAPAASPVQEPFGIDFDERGSMYIVELTSGRLLRRDAAGQIVKLSEHDKKGYSGDGGPVSDAYFDGPHNCVVTSDDALLVADSWNHCVRRIELQDLLTSTIIGTGREGYSGDGGPAKSATFNFVMCIELDPSKRLLHIADLKNSRIRNVDLETGIVRTVAGNGKSGVPRDGDLAVASPLVDPRAAASDAEGNLYVLERNGNALRVVRSDGTIHTVAGTGKKGFRDGLANQAEFGSPKHICCDPAGNVYIADDMNGAIRKYDPISNQVTTLLGRGFGDPRVTLEHPHGVRWHDSALYVIDTGHNRIFKLHFHASQAN
jgi:DNA-binding beta-propeller fold protein YncE